MALLLERRRDLRGTVTLVQIAMPSREEDDIALLPDLLQHPLEATLDEYRKHVERDAPLERRFQPIQLSEPTVTDTVAILKGAEEPLRGSSSRDHHRPGAGGCRRSG